MTRDALALADELIGLATIAQRHAHPNAVLTRLKRIPTDTLGLTGEDLEDVRDRLLHLPPSHPDHDRALAAYLNATADLAMTAAAELRGTTADPLDRRTT